MSIHTLIDDELKNGYIRDDVFVATGLSTGDEIDLVIFQKADGYQYQCDIYKVSSKEKIKNGKFHIHNSFPNRIDGFTEIFKMLESNIIDIEIKFSIRGKIIIIIKEIVNSDD